MHLYRLSAAVVVAVVAVASSTVAAPSVEEYFALRPGLRWSYSNNTSQEVLAQRKVNGQNVLVLKHFVAGKPTSEDYMQFSQGGGVLYYGTRGTVGNKPQLTWYNPPLVLYPKNPIGVGDRWQSSTALGNGTLTLTVRVVGTEGVLTQAGRYNALVVRSQINTSSGAASVTDAYFVPGIGTVRFVTQDGSSVDLMRQ
jgi:hypothetical protein